jgi:hypothetical protein
MCARKWRSLSLESSSARHEMWNLEPLAYGHTIYSTHNEIQIPIFEVYEVPGGGQYEIPNCMRKTFFSRNYFTSSARK